MNVGKLSVHFLIMLLGSMMVELHANGAGKFEPSIESLQNYECPEWFRDAKFGIYLHWGPYSVAEQGEWYARKLYLGLADLVG